MPCNWYDVTITMKQAPVRQKHMWVRLLFPGNWNITKTLVGAGIMLASIAPALAQGRVLGIDVSAWQTELTTAEWATFKRATNQQVGGVFGDGRDFVFIRSSRGGTTGYYNQSDPDNSDGLNTLS